MKDMKEIYQQLKKDYPNKKVRYDKYMKVVYINWEDYEVSADDDIVDLLYKGMPYDHNHPKNYDEIYQDIVYFINNADKIVVKVNKRNKLTNKLLLLFLILLLLSQIYLKYIDK